MNAETKRLDRPVWIWFPGDLEIYHGMLQNFQREERGYGWPAYWKMDDWRKNIRFLKEYELQAETSFRVIGLGTGYVSVDGKKYPLNKRISCSAGKHNIEVYIGNVTGLPSIFIEGNVIYSNKDWLADDFLEIHPVGISSLYEEKEKKPDKVYFEERKYEPFSVHEISDGVLFDFNRMINGTLELIFAGKRQEATVCYGESRQEACDIKWCYYKQEHVKMGKVTKRRAFRYIYIPNCVKSEVTLIGIHQFIPFEVKATFHCQDNRLNRIWEVAKETYCLCSGLFFIDGIKRDRWIWSGDAYQSYFVNPYLLFDEEINKRTILALRGNVDINQHLNTIVDYSLLWLISIEKEYWMTNDKMFVEMIYPKMESLMHLCESQLDEHGFIYGRKQDWIFIDWADIDKTGSVCAEQLLLLKCYKTMVYCGSILGKDIGHYETAFIELKEQVMTHFWDEEKGAFIDSYESGKRHVTRHANIFAILFELADERQTDMIIKNVLLNQEIADITTPYFKFFELDVWGMTGYLEKVMCIMNDYWGGMLDKGAVTFWEEFTPGQDESEQYEMYGDPFGKSLCHAWGASPIYILGRYFLGVRALSPGYETFAVEPILSFFSELDCIVPVKGGKVYIKYMDGILNVEADRQGGILIKDGKRYSIPVR